MNRIRMTWVCCMFLVLGCDDRTSGRTSLSGEVTVQGRPVSEGTVVLCPVGQTDGPASGGKIENGKLTVSAEDGPVPGTHKATVTVLEATGDRPPHGMRALPRESSYTFVIEIAASPNRFTWDLQKSSRTKPSR